jgi:hypothetical protein
MNIKLNSHELQEAIIQYLTSQHLKPIGNTYTETFFTMKFKNKKARDKYLDSCETNELRLFFYTEGHPMENTDFECELFIDYKSEVNK